MPEVIEETKRIEHKVAGRCPYYDEDCKHVDDYVACWSHESDKFPGVCPFVFGMEQ